MLVVPKATRKIRQTLDELLVAAQHGKKMKSEPVAKMVMQNIQEIENEVKQIKEVASKIQIGNDKIISTCLLIFYSYC